MRPKHGQTPAWKDPFLNSKSRLAPFVSVNEELILAVLALLSNSPYRPDCEKS